MHVLTFCSDEDGAGTVPSPLPPVKGHYCCRAHSDHSEGPLSHEDGHSEKKKVQLCASVPPQAGLPVCLRQQKLTVEAFDAASWMKSLCNWLPLQTVRHP